MSAARLADQLPGEYAVERGPPGVLAILRDCAPALRAAGYGLASDGATRESRLAGRRPLLELETPQGTFLVRRFSHGGLLRFLTRERFADPSRPFRELAVAASLARAGVCTPQVAAARARPAGGWGWKLEVVTRRVEDAVDLDLVLAEARAGRLPRGVLRELAREAGSLVRAMHAAGCLHADLTTKNMLVERSALAGGSSRMWILDLDRARVERDPSLADRLANLGRLYRYVRRRERMHGPALARTDALRFLAAYEPDRVRRAAAVRWILAEHSRRWHWHALGWKLESWFSRR